MTRDTLRPGAVYRIRARNLRIGVYIGDGEFIGVREKFGSYYLATESIGWTVMDVFFPEIETLDPEIKLSDVGNRVCGQCSKPVVFIIENRSDGTGAHHHVTPDPSHKVWPLREMNRPLFDALKKIEMENA